MASTMQSKQFLMLTLHQDSLLLGCLLVIERQSSLRCIKLLCPLLQFKLTVSAILLTLLHSTLLCCCLSIKGLLLLNSLLEFGSTYSLDTRLSACKMNNLQIMTAGPQHAQHPYQEHGCYDM